MAEFDEQPLENTEELLEQEAEQEQPKSSKISMVKVGIPIFIVQLIIAYFIASKFIVPKFFSGAHAATVQTSEAASSSQEDGAGDNNFGVIYSLEDVIVNPAHSKGGQFILINLALEVKSNADVDIIKKKEVMIRDILIRLISGKTIDELDGPEDKENLRQEILDKISKVLPKNHLLNVYFSNYLIQ